tara:strand:+ start:341 stop:829 length:489 start_codon:yes stop_codon:yes gene_type:complete
MSITLTSKSDKVSKVYNDESINAVKSFGFTARKSYGTCYLTGKSITKGDECEMLILKDGRRLTKLISTTVAKGKKAVKVQSTSKKRSFTEIAKSKTTTTKVVKKAFKNETKSAFSFPKASVNSVAVREALVSLALASDNHIKKGIIEALPLNVALTIIDLTK